MQATFDVLVDPNRREILKLLRIRPRPVGELVELTGLSQPGVSKHLRLMREAGFVSVTRDAQTRIYALEERRFAELDRWLTDYRQLWSRTLDNLGDFLDANSPSKEPKRDESS